MSYEVLETEYKGNKILEIIKDRKLVIKFGLSKAKAIVAMIDEIKKFVKENSNE